MMFSHRARLGIALILFLLLGVRPASAQESSEAGNAQYRAAAELQRDSQFELAVAAWNNFLTKNPEHVYAPQATLNLGICYLKSKQYDKALGTLHKVLEEFSDAPFRDAAYLYLGVTQFSLGRDGQRDQYLAAAKTLDALLRGYPESKYLAPALYYRAEVDYALGKKEAAANWYGRLVREFPKDRLLPDALYALGATQQELGNFRAAGITYDQFLAAAPGHPRAVEVMMRRGETFYSIGQYPQAVDWFAKAAGSKGFSMADQARFRQADCLTQLKRHGDAAELYASLVREFPNSPKVEEANLAAGKCYYLANEFAKSLDVLAKVIAGRGDALPEATHWSARSLLKQNQPTEAIALLEKTLSTAGGSPWEPQLRLDLADATYEMPKLRPIAVTLYAGVVKRFPQSSVADSALYMAAFTALEQGDFKESLVHAQEFFESYPSSDLLPDVAAVAAESELQLNQLEESQRRYQDLIARYPDHPDAPTWRLRRALILFMQKKYAETVGILQPIMARLPSRAAEAEAYYLMGSSLLQQGRLDDAAAALKASLKADANWRQADDAILVLADTLRQKGEIDQAVETIRHLIETFPKSPLLDQAHYWLAEFAYNAGDMAAARREYETAIRDWPKSKLAPHALFGLGWVQLTEKDYPAAEKTFDRLISEFPEDKIVPWARFARGTARQQLGKYAPAVDDVQAMLAANPSGKDKSDALYVLGLCQSGLKRNDEAVKTFETLLAEDPEYAGADKTLYELAWALKAAGKKDEAAKRFMELAARYADSPLAAESVYHAAEVKYDQKRFDEAAETYDAVIRKTSDAMLKEKALHKQAWCRFSQNQYDRARQAFADQRKTFPGGKLVADAAFMEGECLRKSDKWSEALAAYEHMLALPQKPLGEHFETLALLRAGQAAAQLNQWEKSDQLLARAAQASPDSPYLPDVLFERAQVQEKLGHLDEAAKLYAAVPAKTSREVAARAQFMLGQLLFRQKKHTEAIRTYYEVIYGGRDYPRWQADAVFEAARCFEELKKPDQAIKLYRELLEKYPDSEKAPEAKTRLETLGSG